MPRNIDPLAHLERPDKWYLGGGRAVVFAPPFPLDLDVLGFWDEAHFADIPLRRLFTCFLLGEDGRPFRLQRQSRSWRPDRLRQTYAAEECWTVELSEDKLALAGDVLASRLTARNRGDATRRFTVVVWSLRDQGPFPAGRDLVTRATEVQATECDLRWTEEVGWGTSSGHAEEAPLGQLHLALGANAAREGTSINLAEPAADRPLWEQSVLPEKLHDGRLTGEEKVHVGVTPDGQLHLCAQYTLEVPPEGEASLTVACAVATAPERAVMALQEALAGDAAQQAEREWREYFAGVPYFECSDPYLTRYYWYRWYGLRLQMVEVGEGHLPEPCVFEGVGYFRRYISYSAQCHLRECAWMHDPRFAFGSLLGMLANQEANGRIPGHIGLWREPNGFYHADWGTGALRALTLHPDTDLQARCYEGLVRYAGYLDAERDPEGSGLYDVVNQDETGQEYMPRYQAVDPDADRWKPIRLKGVDATVYLYQLKRALAELAGHRGEEAAAWGRQADAIAAAVRERMWDPEAGFFSDVDPATMQRTGCKAAVGFYPFLTDLAGREHLRALTKHLLNPDEFWLPAGIPSTSKDDPLFSAEAEWKGKRHSCPWNGRQWPMTSSHVCEALARVACGWEAGLRPQAVEAIQRFIRSMFWDGDPARPNCFEHYHPETGVPSAYRGIDDYQHSWVVDLIIRYVAGLRPTAQGEVVVDPLPFGLERLILEDAPVAGHRVGVRYCMGALVVDVDGEDVASRTGLGQLRVNLAPVPS